MKKIRSKNSLKNDDSNANEKKEISLESKIRKIKNSFQSPPTIDPTQLPKKPPNLSKPLKNIFKAFPKGKLVQFGVEYIDCEGEKWDKLIETLKNEECLTIGLFVFFFEFIYYYHARYQNLLKFICFQLYRGNRYLIKKLLFSIKFLF